MGVSLAGVREYVFLGLYHLRPGDGRPNQVISV